MPADLLFQDPRTKKISVEHYCGFVSLPRARPAGFMSKICGHDLPSRKTEQ